MQLSPEQIQAVVDWMNEWDQLKGTAIPMRFKEDFSKSINRLTDPQKYINYALTVKGGESYKVESLWFIAGTDPADETESSFNITYITSDGKSFPGDENAAREHEEKLQEKKRRSQMSWHQRLFGNIF